MCPLAVLVKEDKDVVPAMVVGFDFYPKVFGEFSYASYRINNRIYAVFAG